MKLDANGNPQERTDPRGVTVTSAFGALNRLETVTYPDDPGVRSAYPFPLLTAYQYDGNGNVELVTERKRVSATATAGAVPQALVRAEVLWVGLRGGLEEIGRAHV